MDTVEGERLRRWRLVLGEEAQASCGLAGLSPEDRQMDEALAALVCALAESGVGVVGLTAQTKSLEDIFLSLTQTSGEVA